MELSKKYGSVFTVHLGPKKVVVLAGYKTVKQALVNYAEEFGDREISPIFRDTFKEHGVLFSNGNSWKEMRRFSLTNLRDFGMGKRGSEEKIIEESRSLIEVFENFKGEPFDTTQPVNYSVSNIIGAIIYGTRFDSDSNQPGSYFHDDNLTYTVSNLFAAGTDTTGTTLRWGLLLMAKYPHIQDQVQEELSRVIGDREPRVEDRRNLPYTDAVIHEIQRLADIVPMSLPHTTSCDVTFQGSFVKKGITVILLLTSVLQDEEEWETPHSFNPGHFLDEKGCFIKRDAFMPFSAGRRACLGESLYLYLDDAEQLQAEWNRGQMGTSPTGDPTLQ
ncbi:cytochrome P450 2K1-like [Anguilla anguilla]|uniref:cytochrome P450 2K1-like n=1 Tax=Anguilla anguilla TaxID=7936 RepID=UPI0015A80531|nr:cytochrome P450 2K1-like [Anguilla anguilla]